MSSKKDRFHTIGYSKFLMYASLITFILCFLAGRFESYLNLIAIPFFSIFIFYLVMYNALRGRLKKSFDQMYTIVDSIYLSKNSNNTKLLVIMEERYNRIKNNRFDINKKLDIGEVYSLLVDTYYQLGKNPTVHQEVYIALKTKLKKYNISNVIKFFYKNVKVTDGSHVNLFNKTYKEIEIKKDLKNILDQI